MRKIIFLTILLLFAIPEVWAQTIDPADIPVLANRYRQQKLPCWDRSDEVQEIINTPVGEGWGPYSPTEVDRIKTMVYAAGCGKRSAPGKYTQAEFDSRLDDAISWVEARKYDNFNWWHEEVDIPRKLGEALLRGGGSIDSNHKTRIEALARDFTNRQRLSEWNGANIPYRGWARLAVGLALSDNNFCQTAVDLFSTATSQGGYAHILDDWSYTFHNDKINTLYGTDHFEDFADYLDFVEGTSFSIENYVNSYDDAGRTGIQITGEWIRNWWRWTTYLKTNDPYTVNKYPHKWHFGRPSYASSVLLSTSYSDLSAYRTDMQGIVDGVPTPYGAVSYPMVRYMAVRRPGWFSSVMMFDYVDPHLEASPFAPIFGGVYWVKPSTIDIIQKTPDAPEGSYSYGVLYSPHRLLNLFTVPQGLIQDVLNPGSEWSNRVNQSEVSEIAHNWAYMGVSTLETYYGIAAEYIKDDNGDYEFKKSWFYFDDEIVSLTSNLRSTTGSYGNIYTWIHSFRQYNDTSVQTSNGSVSLPSSEGTVIDLGVISWAYRDGTGYVFPNSERVKVQGIDVNKTKLPYNFSRLFIDHGATPNQAKSAIIILPDANQSQTSTYNQIWIEKFDSQAHIVKETTLNIVGAAFFNGATSNLINSNLPAYVLYRTDNSEFHLSVFNPQQQAGLNGVTKYEGTPINPHYDVNVTNPTTHNYDIEVPFILTKGNDPSLNNVNFTDLGNGWTRISFNLRVHRKIEFSGVSNGSGGFTVDSVWVARNDVEAGASPSQPPQPPVSTNPVADAGGPYGGTVNQTIQFDGSGSTGAGLSYSWNFGDGNTGTGAAPTHTYTAAGVYTVELTVTDSTGKTDTDQTTASISDGSTVTRVTDQLIAFYNFTESSGSTVYDRSQYGSPLDLTVEGIYSWISGRNGIALTNARIRSADSSGKIAADIKNTNAFTFEIWYRPANTTQTGPARLVSVSQDRDYRNFTVGQDSADLQIRLRSTDAASDSFGHPYFTASNVLSTNETHVVVTFDAATDTVKVYRNAVLVAQQARTGLLDNWDTSMPFLIGNENIDSRPLEGEVYMVAVYKKALSASEVQRNYDAGSLAESVVADAGGSYSGYAGETIQFDGSRSTGSGLSYSWDFGDGNTGTGVNPTHVYNTAGTYTVILTVTDGTVTDKDTTQAVINEPGSGRVTDGLIAYYPFTEGSGTSVGDSSKFGTAMDLTITGTEAWQLSWLSGRNGVYVNSNKIWTPSAATKVISELKNTNDFSFEIWYNPYNLTQTSANVLTVSANPTSRNVTIQQYGNDIRVYLRTSDPTTDNAGAPRLVATGALSTTGETHVVVTYNNAEDTLRVYVNGSLVVSDVRLGDLFNWDSNFNFSLASEPDDSRKFEGEIYLIAVYNKPLTEPEIIQNYDAGSNPTIITTTADAGGPYIGAVGEPVEFNGSGSKGSGLSFSWDFGDGDTGTGVRPTHTYTITGTYQVILTVTDASNNTDKDTTQVTISNRPVADAGGPYSGQANQSISFDGSGSTDSDGSIASYSWDFGDGTTGSGVTPIHTYTSSGVYEVILTVTDDVGLTDKDTVQVTVDPAPPVANAGGPYTAAVGDPITFDGSGSSGEGTLTYYWQFGDGSESSGDTVVYSYSTPDTFQVILTVTSEYGSDSDTTEARVPSELPPTADAGGIYSGLTGQAVQFDGSGSRGGGLSYLWDFGDGYTSTNQKPTHIYLSPGTYTVILTVTNTQGSDSDTTTATIDPSRVQSGLVAYYPFFERSGYTVHDMSNYSGPENLELDALVSWIGTRTGISIPQDGLIKTPGASLKIVPEIKLTNDFTFEVWCKPADTTQFGPAQILSISDGTANRNFMFGQNTTSLQVRLRTSTGTNTGSPYLDTNTGVLTDTETHYVVTFDSATDSLKVYKNTVLVASMAKTGDLSNWDETMPFLIGNELSLDRDWLGEIYLVAIYNRALTETEIQQNYNHGSSDDMVLADAGGPYSGAIGDTIQFDGSGSLGAIQTYSWNFGDGNSGSGATPTHVFSAAGTYQVVLTVQNSTGAEDTAVTTVAIDDTVLVPVANAGGPYTGYEGQPIYFDGSKSSGTNITYLWDFGDGTTSDEKTPSHTYSSVGSYQVVLTVTNSSGSDSDTTTATVKIAPPKAKAGGPYEGSENAAVVFDGSESTGRNITSYEWDFGDGTTGTGVTVSHTYTAAGTYTVVLKVTNSSGFDTDTTTAKIAGAKPVANAGGPYDARVGDTVTFDGSGSVGSGLTYEWDFGDGSEATGQIVDYSYSRDGIFTVRLKVTDSNGEEDIDETTATISRQPLIKPSSGFVKTKSGNFVIDGETFYIKGAHIVPDSGNNLNGWETFWSQNIAGLSSEVDRKLSFFSVDNIPDANMTRVLLPKNALRNYVAWDIKTKLDTVLTKADRKNLRVIVGITGYRPWEVEEDSAAAAWNDYKAVIADFKNDKRIAIWETEDNIAAYLESGTTWRPNQWYRGGNFGAVLVDLNGKPAVFVASNSGVSGAVEPAWSDTSPVTDNQITWNYAGSTPWFGADAQDSLYNWVKLVVDSIKANDPNHLVAGFAGDLFYITKMTDARFDFMSINQAFPFHFTGPVSDLKWRVPSHLPEDKLWYGVHNVWQFRRFMSVRKLGFIPLFVEKLKVESDSTASEDKLEKQKNDLSEALEYLTDSEVAGVMLSNIQDSDRDFDGLTHPGKSASDSAAKKPAFFVFRNWQIKQTKYLSKISPFDLETAGVPDIRKTSLTNLILNGDFMHWTEGDTLLPNGWDYEVGRIDVSVKKRTDILKYGNASLEIKALKADGYAQVRVDIHLPPEWFKRLSGEFVTLSLWARTEAANSGTAKIEIIDKYKSSETTVEKDGAWHRVVLTHVVDDRNRDGGYLIVRFSPGSSGDILIIDGLMLVIGREPLEFKNNPRDFIYYVVSSPVVDLSGPALDYPALWTNPGVWWRDPLNCDTTCTIAGRKAIKQAVIQYVRKTDNLNGVEIRAGTSEETGTDTRRLLSIISDVNAQDGTVIDVTQQLKKRYIDMNASITVGTDGFKGGTGMFVLTFYLLDYK